MKTFSSYWLLVIGLLAASLGAAENTPGHTWTAREVVTHTKLNDMQKNIVVDVENLKYGDDFGEGLGNGLGIALGSIPFESVSAMKAFDFTNVPSGTRVSCSGYSTAQDGYFGPDVFWDPTSTASDNGLTVFDPTLPTGAGRLVRTLNGEINIQWGGATETAAADNTAVINLCLATSNHVFIPDGTFEYSGLIDVSDEKRFYGVSHGNSILKANHADARVNVSSNSHVHDLRIDGDDTAEFGMIVEAASSGAYVEHVRILNHTEGGLVLDGCQNSTFVSLKISNNKRNIAFANDARNNALFGVQTRYSGATIPSHADNRHIWAGEWSHAKLVASPPYGGNTIMRNVVIGGVFESEHGNDYAVEFYDGGLAGHGWSFFQTEFTSFSGVTAIVKVDANFDTTLSFTDCKFEGSYAFEIGTGQVVKATNCDYTGGGAEGKTLGSGHVVLGVDQLDAGFNVLSERDATDNTIFKYGIGDWIASGTSTVAHNGTTKVMDITSPSTTGNSGAKVLPSRMPTVITAYDDRVVEIKVWIENNLAQREITGMDAGADTLTLDTTDWNVLADFTAGDAVIYREGDSAITGLTDGQTYYVEATTTTTVTLEETIGGGVVDITSTLPTGTHYLEFVNPNILLRWVTYDGSYSTRDIGYMADGMNTFSDRLQGDEVGIEMISQKVGGQSWSSAAVRINIF